MIKMRFLKITKAEHIERYGIQAYEEQLKRVREWRHAHPENNEKWHKQMRDWGRKLENKRKSITLLSGNEEDSHWGISIQVGSRTKTFGMYFNFDDYTEARGRGYVKDIREKNRLLWLGENKKEQKLAIQVINRFGKSRKKKSYMK